MDGVKHGRELHLLLQRHLAVGVGIVVDPPIVTPPLASTSVASDKHVIAFGGFRHIVVGIELVPRAGGEVGHVCVRGYTRRMVAESSEENNTDSFEQRGKQISYLSVTTPL